MGGRGFADGDYFVLSPNKAANASARIEHPAPIVFVGDVERGQIVNGRNQPARMLPDHPAIAWNVQEVESEATSKGWKLHLMPENVFDGRSKSFRDRDQAHVVTRELEQVQKQTALTMARLAAGAKILATDIAASRLVMRHAKVSSVGS